MKLRIKNLRLAMLAIATVGLVAGLINVDAQQFEAGKKAKVRGTIQSRSGDIVKIKAEKTGDAAVIVLSDTTKVERERDFRLRPADMDITALVPGLKIEAEGEGNAKGQLDANKIKFDPNTFAIEIAEEQQIQANQAAASHAQSTANQGVSDANQAQASANQAQSTADAAGQVATAAGAASLVDAAGIQEVNERVSDLADYQTVAEEDLFFPTGQATLADDQKAALKKLASGAASVQNYMIEIAGYASTTGTKAENLKLSDERATVVANYLRDSGNVPMRRILVPAGYGASHPAVSNQTTTGQDINQRVDVKVIVNKGIEEGAM